MAEKEVFWLECPQTAHVPPRAKKTQGPRTGGFKKTNKFFPRFFTANFVALFAAKVLAAAAAAAAANCNEQQLAVTARRTLSRVLGRIGSCGGKPTGQPYRPRALFQTPIVYYSVLFAGVERRRQVKASTDPSGLLLACGPRA